MNTEDFGGNENTPYTIMIDTCSTFVQPQGMYNIKNEP